MSKSLVLASSSISRRQQLQTLNLPFVVESPDIDENPHPKETADELVRRLAYEKCQTLSARFAHHLIIGGDQTATLNGAFIGKPLTEENARQQLHNASGKELIFTAGLCVLDADSGQHFVDAVDARVKFRRLSERQITDYVELDKPLHCAGSFKSESLGISLFERIQSDDPSAITGMPLICLTNLLMMHGYDPIVEARANFVD